MPKFLKFEVIVIDDDQADSVIDYISQAIGQANETFAGDRSAAIMTETVSCKMSWREYDALDAVEEGEP